MQLALGCRKSGSFGGHVLKAAMSLSHCGSGTMSSQQQGQNYQERTVLRGSWRMCAGCFFRSTFILVDNIYSGILCIPAFLYTQRFSGASVCVGGGQSLTSSTNTRQRRQKGLRPRLLDLCFLNNPMSLTAGLEIKAMDMLPAYL